MKASLVNLLAPLQNAIASGGHFCKRRLAVKLRGAVSLLLIFSLLASSIPARADDGMGMGGDGGGFDLGGLFDAIGDVVGGMGDDGGYDYDNSGNYYYPQDYDQGYQQQYQPGYQNQPQYQQPYYGPAYTPPQVPRNTPPTVRYSASGSGGLPQNSSASRRDGNPAAGTQNPRSPHPPKPNAPMAVKVRSLSQDEIDTLTNLTSDQVKTLVQQLVFDRNGKAAQQAAEALGDALTPKEQESLSAAITAGSTDSVRQTLKDKGVDPLAQATLEKMADLHKAIDQLRIDKTPTAAHIRALTDAFAALRRQIQQLARELRDLNRQLQDTNRQLRQLNEQLGRQAQLLQQLITALNRESQAINNLARQITQLINSQQLIALLLRAIPNTRQMPSGSSVQIVSVPGLLPPGTVAPMGPGSAMVGPPKRPGQPMPRGPYAGPMSITTGSVLEALGMPRAVGSPIRDSSANVISDIVMHNAADSTVGYVVDNQSYSLDPQFFQAFRGKSGTVSFDRGTGDNASYTVTPGTYEFTATQKGWELYRKSYKATIDNSLNPSDFQVMQGEQPVTIAAGESQTLESSYPVAVRFDNGNGKVKEKRLLDGNYLVAAGDQSGALDLYDSAQVVPPTTDPKSDAGADRDFVAEALMDAVERAANSEPATRPVTSTPRTVSTTPQFPAGEPTPVDQEGDEARETVVEFIDAIGKAEEQREKAAKSSAKKVTAKKPASVAASEPATRPAKPAKPARAKEGSSLPGSP